VVEDVEDLSFVLRELDFVGSVRELVLQTANMLKQLASAYGVGGLLDLLLDLSDFLLDLVPGATR
jgi:hypothetical protein